jgi:tetratricopeptide (TPR) repeat protein
MIYVTEPDFCPLGCGSVMFLKSIESGKIFVHCSCCGLAWDKPPTPHVVDISEDIPETFAPAGIEFPRREEIEAAGFGGYIAAECQDEDHIKSLWRLRAKTFFAAGDYAKGIAILTEAIDTLHGPPSTAFYLRAAAYRCTGDFQRAADDDRTAEQVRLQYAASFETAAKQRDK